MRTGIKNTAISIFYVLICSLPGAGPVILADAGSSATQPVFDLPDLPPEFATIRKSAETQSIRISIDMARIVPQKTPILANFELTNGRSEFIQCDHDDDASDFIMSLVDFEGRPVPHTEYGRLHQGSPYTFTFNPGLRLKPGDKITRQYDLAKYFKISSPGPYRLHVLKAVAWTPSFKSPGKELEVDMDSIIFDVK